MLRADMRVTNSLWNPLILGSSEDFNNFNFVANSTKRGASRF
jgi:hypothetical protein